MPEILTTKLNNGREVLAKLYKGQPSAVTYANRTQAYRKVDALGPGWEVCGWHPFYVAKARPLMELFAETHPQFQASIQKIALYYQKTLTEVYGWWKEYEKASIDQSAILEEFEGWYQPKLSGKPAVSVCSDSQCRCTCHPLAANGKVYHHVDCAGGYTA